MTPPAVPGTDRPRATGDCGPGPACLELAAPLPEDAAAEIAALFKALAHPARVMIVAALARCPGACCGEIVRGLPLAQSTVSQHLAVLKEAGVVTMRDEGRSCRYQLSPETASRLARAGGQLLDMDFPSGMPSPSNRAGDAGLSRKATA